MVVTGRRRIVAKPGRLMLGFSPHLVVCYYTLKISSICMCNIEKNNFFVFFSLTESQ